jgi:hypothetical protein
MGGGDTLLVSKQVGLSVRGVTRHYQTGDWKFWRLNTRVMRASFRLTLCGKKEGRGGFDCCEIGNLDGS